MDILENMPGPKLSSSDKVKLTYNLGCYSVVQKCDLITRRWKILWRNIVSQYLCFLLEMKLYTSNQIKLSRLAKSAIEWTFQ